MPQVCVNTGKLKPWWTTLPFRNLCRQMERLKADGSYIGMEIPNYVGVTCKGEFVGNGTVRARDACIVTNVRDSGGKTLFDYTVTGRSFGVFTSGEVNKLRIWQPGYSDEEPTPFTDRWLQSVAPFHDLRWMDYNDANSNDSDSLDDGSSDADITWATVGKGIPWEVIAKTSAHLRKGAWICIPPRWDEGSVRRLAELFHKHLKDLPVEVMLEDTNEYWNWRFPQAKVVDALAKASAASLSLDKPSTNGPRHSWHAHRTIRLGQIFRDVFVDNGTRIKPVLTCQLAEPESVKKTLDWINARYGAPKSWISAVAFTAYYGHTDVGALPNGATAAQVAAAVMAGAKRMGNEAVSSSAKGAAEIRDKAYSYGLPTFVYEGGGDVGEGDRLLAAKNAAQDHPDNAKALEVAIDGLFASQPDPRTRFFVFQLDGPRNASGNYQLRWRHDEVETEEWKAAERACRKHNGTGTGTPTPTPTTPIPTPVPVLSPPTGLKVHPTAGVTWDKTPGANSYRVYLNGVKVDDSGNEHARFFGDGLYTVTAIRGGSESAHSAGVRYGVDPQDELRARLIEIDRRLAVIAPIMVERDALLEERARIKEDLGE